MLERVGVSGFGVEAKVPRPHHYDLAGTLLAGHRRFPRDLFGFTFQCFNAALFVAVLLVDLLADYRDKILLQDLICGN